ncbi:hypothetical protein, partial [Streptomyces sp. NPDC005283]|uniref:hypothetical protein n=1 Tax=Streptomyces sp. NPDC005283 TaxID=3156871 RepID=UPI0034539826
MQSAVVSVGTEHGLIPRHVHVERVALVLEDLLLGRLDMLRVPIACLRKLCTGGNEIGDQRLVVLCLRWLPPASPDRCDGPAVSAFHLHSIAWYFVAHVKSARGAVPVFRPARFPGAASRTGHATWHRTR